jgi:hypothetical protein
MSKTKKRGLTQETKKRAAAGEQALRVDVPFTAWKAAERLAQARTLDSLEILLAALTADLAEAAEWPTTRGAWAAREWMEAHYAPAQWLEAQRREAVKEDV